MDAIPQWLRFVGFLASASIALTPFLVRAKKIGWGWLISLFWGAIALFSVRLFQIPIQEAINSVLIGSNVPSWARMAFYIAPSGLIQEISKALLPALFILMGVKMGTSKGLYGPAAGAGFGIAEAVWLVGLSPGNIGAIAMVERLSAIIFHASATSIAIGGGKPRKMLWGLPLAIVLHSLYNYIAVSLMNKTDFWTLEAIIGVLSLLIWVFAIFNSKSKDQE